MHLVGRVLTLSLLCLGRAFSHHALIFQSLAAAQTHITNAHRTCDLILGVGDGKAEMFNGIQYSASVANFYNDTDMSKLDCAVLLGRVQCEGIVYAVPETWYHQRIENVVYYGMDWLCPGVCLRAVFCCERCTQSNSTCITGYDLVLHKQLNQYYGNITAENTMRYITPIVQTGSCLTLLPSNQTHAQS
jgi:isopenicillin-N N-acyltransferase-like protein